MTANIPPTTPTRIAVNNLPPVVRRSDIFGVPKLALWIVLVNMVAWCVGVSLLYIVTGNPPAKIVYLMLGEFIVMVFVLVVVFAWWKLFWWIMGCSFSCATAL